VHVRSVVGVSISSEPTRRRPICDGRHGSRWPPRTSHTRSEVLCAAPGCDHDGSRRIPIVPAGPEVERDHPSSGRDRVGGVYRRRWRRRGIAGHLTTRRAIIPTPRGARRRSVVSGTGACTRSGPVRAS
jgi:hypothetical protein